jgi:hypothetical protein
MNRKPNSHFSTSFSEFLFAAGIKRSPSDLPYVTVYPVLPGVRANLILSGDFPCSRRADDNSLPTGCLFRREYESDPAHPGDFTHDAGGLD